MEPSTGSIVEVHDVIETLYVAPDPTVLPKLREVLARYPNVPATVQGVTALDQLATQPIMVFQNSFSQTDASVADVAKTVKDAKKLKDLATTTVPNALRYGGIGLTVLGLLLALVPKRSSRRGKGGAPEPDEQPVEVRLAPGEQVVVADPHPGRPRADGRRAGGRRAGRGRAAGHGTTTATRRAPGLDGDARPRRAAAGYTNVPPYSSRSAAFWTLPMALRGSSSTNEHRAWAALKRGQLPGERRRSRPRRPRRRRRATTTATTASPKSGCGTPITAHSATPGRSSSTTSTSLG